MNGTAEPASLAKYTRIIQLGKGGMAVVYLAAMRAAHGATKLVVVKELLPDLALDPEFRVMFVDEARLATRLSHPNVVNTFEVLDDGAGKCSLVMEYLEGQPLSRLRHALRDHPLFLPLQLAVLADVLNGLEYAHGLKDYDGTPLGIVHRDISPHNVFVNYTGEVKLVDFGIAKANDSIAETRVGVVKGKFGYMAPEQAIGSKIDKRADIFSAGVMLFEAMVGARLWKGLNEAAIMHRLTNGEIPRASEVRPDVSPALDAICQKALAANPEDRYASAAEFLRDLEVATGGLPSRRLIGDTVSQLFAEERAKIARVLEEQVGSLRPTSSGGFTSPSSSPRVVTFPAGTLSEAQQPEPIFVPQVPSPYGNSVSGQTSASTVHSVQPPSLTPPSRWPLMAAGAVVFLVLGVMTTLALKTTTPTNNDSSIGAAGTTSVRSSTPSTKSTLTLSLHPPDAKLSIDGSGLPPGTTKLEGLRDSLPRTLHVEAPGYKTKDVTLSFVIDTTVEITLEPATATPPATQRVTGTSSATVVVKPNVAKPTTSAKPTSTEPDIGY